MPTRNLFTDAQTMAALRGLSKGQLNRLPRSTARTLAKAKDGLEAADRLMAKAEDYTPRQVLVYEPTVEALVIEGNCADRDDSMVDYALRYENVHDSESIKGYLGSLVTQAAALRTYAVSTSVKRALSSV